MTSTVSSPSRQPEPAGKLVYGYAEICGCLAFADADTAAEEADEITAIASARTWGEARRVATRHTWNPTGPDDAEPGEPSDEEPFDIKELDSAIERYWPGMVTSRALTLLPEDIQARFGTKIPLLDGEYLEIPLAAEEELVAVLRERGFEVTRDDHLINTLDGYGFS